MYFSGLVLLFPIKLNLPLNLWTVWQRSKAVLWLVMQRGGAEGIAETFQHQEWLGDQRS